MLARLVSIPFRLISGQAWLGIATRLRFPRLEQFCLAGFPASTQVLSSPPRPAWRSDCLSIIGQDCSEGILL